MLIVFIIVLLLLLFYDGGGGVRHSAFISLSFALCQSLFDRIVYLFVELDGYFIYVLFVFYFIAYGSAHFVYTAIRNCLFVGVAIHSLSHSVFIFYFSSHSVSFTSPSANTVPHIITNFAVSLIRRRV